METRRIQLEQGSKKDIVRRSFGFLNHYGYNSSFYLFVFSVLRLWAKNPLVSL